MMNFNKHGSVENYGIDRISSLPDDVLTHILTFLSTREAVQTCILSKRWIKKWASVPDLKFNIEEIGLPEIFINNDMAVELVNKFEMLVRNVLEKRETSCVNKFQFCFDSDVYWPPTQTVVDCISDVMNLGPRECLVEMDLCENLNINTDLVFTCASLMYLRLQLSRSAEVDAFVAIEPNSVNLPCLKTLNLVDVNMSDDSFKKLLLGCPVLEELMLEYCYLRGIIKICSDTLKKLVLCKCYDVMSLQISTQNLLYLDIYVDTRDILLLNMPLLVDASIYLPGWYDQDKYVTMGPKLIHSLSNVESLQLKFDCPNGKVQEKDFSSCPVFDNLKRLELLSWGFHVFELAPYFLHHSPKLQELTLEYEHVQKKDLSYCSVFHHFKRLRLELTLTNIHIISLSLSLSARVMKFIDEEITQEGMGDALFQREFLKTVRIIGFKNDNGFIDNLINKLLVQVKIISEIDIVRRDPWP